MILPVVRELRRRGQSLEIMLAEPAASFAARDGFAHERLDQPTLEARAAAILQADPAALLLGTSPAEVVERTLATRTRGRVATVAVLDAMLFVERRFGPDLRGLPDLTACPDAETAERLRQAGAGPERVVVTGSPVLEALAAEYATYAKSATAQGEPAGPLDVLFVSQPVGRTDRPDEAFSIDEHGSLGDLLGALAGLGALAPNGYRVRIRWHPAQCPGRLPSPPPNVRIESDDEADRLGSVARARAVVGISSTLLTEARMLARPAIAYLPGPYWLREQVYPPYQGVRIARSAEQLASFLEQALTAEPDPAPLERHAGAAGKAADLLLGASRWAGGGSV